MISKHAVRAELRGRGDREVSRVHHGRSARGESVSHARFDLRIEGRHGEGDGFLFHRGARE